MLGLPLLVKAYPQITHAVGELTVLHTPLSKPCVPGRLDVANAQAVMNTLERSIVGCLAGEFSALVTGPVQKSVINDAGVDFSGHTELLAQRCAADDVVMLLVAGDFRVALATTHLPLRKVPDAIEPILLERRLRILHASLVADFALPKPRVLVCGLNPHAGEAGHLGREEIECIAPVVKRLQDEGVDILGPLPADTVFTPKYLAAADAVMAMYHDQGLPTLKYAGFGQAVNVTLGLPIIRTSVDHGTALDIAGSGAGDSGSFAAAIAMASTLVEHRCASA